MFKGEFILWGCNNTKRFYMINPTPNLNIDSSIANVTFATLRQNNYEFMQ